MVNDYFFNWLDVLWIPLALMLVRKKQRLNVVLFIAACIFTLRLQVELMESVGYSTGFLPLLTFPELYRGYIVYGFFIGVFVGLSRWSRERDVYINMAAAITVYISAFCVSTFIMAL